MTVAKLCFRRPLAFRLVFAASVIIALPACGSEGGPTDASQVSIDSALVDVLADLHLADARAFVVADSASAPATGDSARTAVLASHQMTEAQLDKQLRALADEPVVGSATYMALETRLSMERQGATQ